MPEIHLSEPALCCATNPGCTPGSQDGSTGGC